MPSAPDTAAVRFLAGAAIPHRLVGYGDVRSAEEAAEARGIELGALAKTLVVRVEEGSYVLVLIPGDRGLDYGKLRSHLGVRRLMMPDPEEAMTATGYARGTITPFGAGDHPVVIDEALLAHDEISLGSGAPNWAIHLAPSHLLAIGATSAPISK
ncbi:MAG TPA: YbaK/EbsC family protein [Acidimicrobiia bacterium]|nr:YbaK/EbsC family protein [Acidimicrobiia bacterium]